MLVTFDFDDTLTLPVEKKNIISRDTYWACSMNPNTTILKRLKTLHNHGHAIEIVTARSKMNEVGVWDFIDSHDLPIQTVHFTNGDPKIETLLKLNSELHFDDFKVDLEDCREHGIETVCVVHPLDATRDWIHNHECVFI